MYAVDVKLRETDPVCFAVQLTTVGKVATLNQDGR